MLRVPGIAAILTAELLRVREYEQYHTLSIIAAYSTSQYESLKCSK